MSLTLHKLSAMSDVSVSHLGRIERGERFPSARILRKITEPLGLGESELFALAGYLSPQPLTASETIAESNVRHLDPIVAGVLAEEPVDAQRTVIGILSILKSIGKGGS